jgi:predicted Zn-dependent protease
VKGLTAFYNKTIIVQKVEPIDNRLLAESKKRYSADSILKRFKSPQNTVVITSVDIVTPKTKVTNEWGIFGLGLRPGKVCVISSFKLKKNATAKLLAERLQ